MAASSSVSTTDLLIGGGSLLYNEGGNDGNAGNGLLSLGNLVNLAVAREIAELFHFSFNPTALARQKDLSLVTDLGLSLNITVDMLGAELWNILLFGNGTTTDTQTGTAITDELHDAPIILNRSIFTNETNISALTIDAPGGTPTYDVTDDYILKDAVTGEIEIVDGGAITTGLADIELNYTSAARTRKKIIPGKDTSNIGSAVLEVQTTNGRSLSWFIQHCEIRPDGDSPIASDGFSESNLILNLLVDKVVTPSEPFGYVHVE
jgi:hypothetical protein